MGQAGRTILWFLTLFERGKAEMAYTAERDWRTHLAALVVLVLMPRVALAADEYRLREEPPPRSIEEDKPPLERTFEAPEERDQGLLPRLVPAMEEALSDLPPFLRDTRLGVDFRTYYFRRRTNDNRDQEAAAIGGVLDYRSGWLWDRLQAGAALFTSQKLYGPQDRDGTGLLAPGQDGYTVLGEAFLTARAFDHALTGYRHRLGLPYLNGNDGRMTPTTFEGISLVGDLGPVRYVGGHLFEIKLRNDDEFIPFSKAAGINTGSDKGLSFALLRIEPFEGFEVGATNQYVPDTLNTAYVELDWLHTLGDELGLRLGAQFTHQRSVGDDRLTGEDFETWVAGARIEAGFRDALLTLALSVTDDEERVRNPYGSYPGYLGMMQRNFNDPNEKAWGIGGSLYLGWMGLSNLSLALRYTEGYDRIDADTGADLGDRREINSTLDYRIRAGTLEGLWLRARFAWGRVDDTRRDSLEGRLVLRYEFGLL
jgi:hypothetical protein